MLERLVPDAAFRGQLVGFWDAHPIIQQRFPGGIVQFAQWAGQMPEDEMEDVFLAIGAMAAEQPGEGGGMPGAMPGGEVVVDFVDPEDVEDVEDAGGNHPAVARAQAMRPVGEENDDGEGDEEEEEEEQEVAVRALVCRD